MIVGFFASKSNKETSTGNNKKKKLKQSETIFRAVLWIRIRIRIHRIHMFLGLLDPEPFIIKQN